MHLQNNEIFLYKEISYPLGRSLIQKIFTNSIYSWKYRFILGENTKTKENHYYTLDSLMEGIKRNYNFEEKELLVILTNKDFSTSFYEGGTHGETWKIIQKGLTTKEFLNLEFKFFENQLNYDGFSQKSISLENIFK